MTKTIITKELIIKENIKKKIIGISIALFIFFVMDVLCLMLNDKEIETVLFFGFFVAVLMFILLSELNKMKLVKKGEYTIVVDVLIDKKSKMIIKRRSTPDIDFYFYFQNYENRIKAKSQDYEYSNIGDEFYLVKVGGEVYLFNRNEYELEEEY